MSTWSPTLNIIIIITPIRDATVVYHHHHSPPITRTFLRVNPQVTPRSRLLRVHHHWHILCQRYSVIVGGYHLGLFTQHLDLQLYVSGYGHARNDLLLLSHVYSMSQILPVVYSSYTSLYFPSFESRLSSSNLFSKLSLRLIFAIHNLPILFSEI